MYTVRNVEANTSPKRDLYMVVPASLLVIVTSYYPHHAKFQTFLYTPAVYCVCYDLGTDVESYPRPTLCPQKPTDWTSGKCQRKKCYSTCGKWETLVLKGLSAGHGIDVVV